MTDGTRKRFHITRRGFLLGTAAAGTGLVLGVTLGRERFHRAVAGRIHDTMVEGMGAPVADPDAWFEITPDNVVRFNVVKMEMGQGVHTALTQIAADELGADWQQMEVRRSDTTFGPPESSRTFGSFSVVATFEPLRIAAASIRSLLVAEAGNRLGVPVQDLEVHLGTVRVRSDPDSRLTFGEIVEGVTEWPEPPPDPALKSPSNFVYIGKSMPRIDFRDKLIGKPVYAYDASKPGMLYGAVARPPTIEATMTSANPRDAAGMPGVEAVVIDVESGFAGVAARTREQARRAVSALDVRWQEGRAWNQDEIESLLVTDSSACTSIWRRGDGEAALGDQPLVAEYVTPFAVHAQLEPQAALVDPMEGEAYVSAQGLEDCQARIAEILGIEASRLTVHNAYLGGSFGRKTGLDSGVEAARLAKATGRPVHVGWTREEDMRHGHVRPAQRNRLRASVAGGRITALAHNIVSGVVLFPSFPKILHLIAGEDPGIWVSGINPYRAVPSYETRVNSVKLPVRTGAWRGLGTLANTFAAESFMDEIAHFGGADPLQFRLDHLDESLYNRRIRDTLLAAAELGRYGSPAPPGHARGIAVTDYHDCVAALVVEISVEDTGTIRVHRASAAADVGLVINPDGAAAQAQGSIVMGLSSTLIEELTIRNGAVEAANFDRYPLLTNSRTPEIEVRILESDGRPRGMGEPMIGPVAAAVGNAFFNLTGRRLRRIPFTTERVKAGLAWQQTRHEQPVITSSGQLIP